MSLSCIYFGIGKTHFCFGQIKWFLQAKHQYKKYLLIIGVCSYGKINR